MKNCATIKVLALAQNRSRSTKQVISVTSQVIAYNFLDCDTLPWFLHEPPPGSERDKKQSNQNKQTKQMGITALTERDRKRSKPHIDHHHHHQDEMMNIELLKIHP